MTRLIRPLAAAAGCTAAALLAACGPSTALPSDIASCKSPDAVCFASAGAVAQCVDLATDVDNCGSCGNVCGVPEQGGTAACVQGSCVPGCQAGLTVCGVGETVDAGPSADGGVGAQVCVDTSIDPNHCGSCGTRCLDTQICTAGACVAAGTPAQGTTACAIASDGGVVYENLQTDPANCGACGNACAVNEICLAGACDPCDVAACNNTCVDTNTDPNNCGACGTVAPACDNGTPLPLPVITVSAPTSSGFLPAGTPTVAVSVASGIRIASVTVVAKLTNGGTTTTSNLFELSAAGDPNLSPSSWSFSWSALLSGTTAMPALLVQSPSPETVELDFAAFDEDYRVERSDAASHTSTLVWKGAVEGVTPITVNVPSATTTVSQAPGTALPAGSWVPLNGAPIVLTETASAAPSASSGIVGIEFHSIGSSDVALGGAGSVVAFNGPVATLTVNPSDLGVGARQIYAEQVDVFGNRIVSGSPLTLTVGDITPYTAGNPQPILAHDAAGGSDTIWLFGPAATQSGAVCPTAAPIYAQPYDQPAASSAAIGTKAGAAVYCTDSFYETAESTGVYGVVSDGSAISRFDGATAVTGSFIAPVAPSKLRSIVPGSVTGAAMAVDDTAGNGWFAAAVEGTGDAAPSEAGGADGGTFVAVPPVGGGNASDIASSTSGALWSWVDVPTGTSAPASQYQLDVFHPAISNAGSRIKSYLAAAGSTPTSLTVFPGGEFVWEEADANGNLSLGAGRFDGTNPPVDITGGTYVGNAISGNSIPIGVAESLRSTAFFVPSPGVLVGLIPSSTSTLGTGSNGTDRTPDTATATSAGYEVIEIDLTATPAKLYHPATITLTGTTPAFPSGQVLLSGVTDRFGNFNTFTVSDDLKKVLYVTKAPATTGPSRDEYSINLLDLASGTSTQVYTSEYINNNDTVDNGGKGALTVYPHFLHGMNSYAGLGAASTTPPILSWAEELPAGGATPVATVYERLFYANYTASPVAPMQIDRLAFASYDGAPPGLEPGSTAQLVAESVTGDAVYFLSDDGDGTLSLYSRAFDGSTSATLVSSGVTNWALREDVGRQLVLRSDGTLLVGALAGNAAPSPIYKTDAGGNTNLTLMPLAGFTPDGGNVWTLVNAGESFYSPNAQAGVDAFLTGTLVSINLTTGARTDWGPSVSFLYQLIAPSLAFIGPSAGVLYGVDQATDTESTPRLFTAVSTAGTVHVGLNLPVAFPSSTPLSEASYSLNLSESIFEVSTATSIDVTADRTTAQPFPPISSAVLAGPLPRAQPNFPAFGPTYLPLWAIANANSNGVFKMFGGATYQAPITITAGATVTPATAWNRLTPDFSQYLAGFLDGSLYYVMKLPGTGTAPLVAAPQ